MAEGKPYAECLLKSCDWDHIYDTYQGAVICETLHMLTKHPEQYRDLTGKDPEVMKRKYEDEIKFFRRTL